MEGKKKGKNRNLKVVEDALNILSSVIVYVLGVLIFTFLFVYAFVIWFNNGTSEGDALATVNVILNHPIILIVAFAFFFLIYLQKL